MLVIVDSLTGQGERFAKKLGYPYVMIQDYQGEEDQLFLLTRSFNFGEISQEALDFLNQYADRVVGVAVSGNRNWGTNYGAAGDKIAKQYGIELVLKYEGSGFGKDIEYVKAWLKEKMEE